MNHFLEAHPNVPERADIPNHATKGIVYLLIEEARRELDSRLLIATHLIRLGFEVVIAPQWNVWEALGTLPRGVILFKGNNLAQAKTMRTARRLGFLVASIEEELLGVADSREVRRIYDQLSGDNCDLFLVHGEEHARALKDHFGVGCPTVRIVGNPRTDLLRGQFGDRIRSEGRDLSAQYGRYILVNTNFASINPRSGDTVGYLELCRAAGVTNPSDPASMTDFFTWCGWEHENLQSIVELIHALRGTKIDAHIIIRPHPSENITLWQNAFDTIKGVSVIREGDHLPWTAGASLLVHPGSTTGLESAILGTPTMNLCCHENEWHGLYLSTLLNPLFKSIDAAVQAILDHLDGKTSISAIRPDAEGALKRNLLIGDQQSAALVAEQIAAVSLQLEPGSQPSRFASAVSGALRTSERKIDREAFSPKNIRARFTKLASQAGVPINATVETSPDCWVKLRPSPDDQDRAGA
jgi:surface carbohydrate biosynthesis protein